MRHILVNDDDDSNKFVTGYYGSLEFIDEQPVFTDVFGPSPQMLASDPLDYDDLNDLKKLLRAYLDRCRLDAYLHSVRQDYVGDTAADQSLSNHEIGRNLQKLKQLWKDNHGRFHLDTPDELFNKFNSVATNLPSDAREWPLAIASTFYAALTEELTTRMVDKGFKMPSLIGLIHKTDQFAALRKVRDEAVTCYRSMLEEEERLDNRINIAVKGNAHHKVKINTLAEYSPQDSTAQEQSNTDTTSGKLFFQRESQAEMTIRLNKYKQHESATPAATDHGRRDIQYPQSGTGVEAVMGTRKVNGVEHPYDPEWDFTSEFPVGFRGCFICGKADHFSKADCPIGIGDKSVRQKFFNELWCHRPATTKTRRPPPPHIQQRASRVRENAASINVSRTENPRNINNEPAWMTAQKKRKAGEDQDQTKNSNDSKKRQSQVVLGKSMFVFRGRVFVATQQNDRKIRNMPLEIENNLPGMIMSFLDKPSGSNTTFLLNVDSCAALNVGNLLVHQYIITKYPELVDSYEEYSDENPFQPVLLDCAVEDLTPRDDAHGKLTAVVRYKSCYTDVNGDPILISFGLGKDVAVNAIVGIPFIKQWGLVLNFPKAQIESELTNVIFDMVFKEAKPGLPNSIQFDYSHFRRPGITTAVGKTLLTNIPLSHEINDQ